MSWKRYFRRSKWDDERARELSAHLQIEADENISRGMLPDEARYAANKKLGNATSIREEIYRMNSIGFVETLWQDVRFALRMLRKNPGFMAIAVLTLALGIGANTAIFSVVHAVLLKPLPFANADQLVTLFQARAQDGAPVNGWSYMNFADLHQQNRVFSEMAGTQYNKLTLTGRGVPSVTNVSIVTPELFSVLEASPIAGRTFRSADGTPGAEAVVILSEALWRGTFGADPNAIGSTIQLDKKSFTIVGVMPGAFRYPLLSAAKQVWIPLVQDPLFGPWMAQRGGHWLTVIGRLKPGVSAAEAQTEMDVIGARLASEFPEANGGWKIQMMPLQGMLVGSVRPALLVLLGAVGLVLLIACANIANLLLTRATSRAREIAVRTALGAGRGRIIRQLLSETAVLGLLGGMAGILLAYWGVQALTTLLPSSLPRINAIRVDGSVLGFALLLSALASCVFGLAPALFAANSGLQTNLREGGGRSGESGWRRRIRSFVAAGEIALAMVLLVGAGLFLRSFSKLMAVKPGFETEHVMKAEVSLPRFKYKTPQQWSEFASDLIARIQTEPGLENTAVAFPLPLANNRVNLSFEIIGAPPVTAGSSRTADYVAASQNYFRVVGIPLVVGRSFDERDVRSAPPVTVISQAFARVYFPNQNPIGQHLISGFPPDPALEREIVGVVGNVRDFSLSQEPGPMMYVPFVQAPFWGPNLVTKTTLSPADVAGAVRRQVQQIDKELPVSGVIAMPDAISATVAQPKFRTLLLGLFAAMALVLAATGIFGVISYSVSCRTQEIGIRVALGAQRGAILRMVLRETLIVAFIGLAIGIPCALAASRLIGHMLFGVSADDPATLAVVAIGLTAVAMFAGYVPARRAMRVDPMVALRHE